MQFQENISLAPFTTFGIGGPARWLAEVRSEADLEQAVEFGRRRELRLFVLGGGSNLLVGEAGFDGLVVRIAIPGAGESRDAGGMLFRVGAGEDWDGFVSRTVERDCAGIECLAGIPGTVGGTPVQNVGAYGQEVSQTISSVRALDTTYLTFVEMPAAECRFAYRSSLFNTEARGRYIVTRVDFRLVPGGTPLLDYADLKRYFQGRAAAPSLIEVAGAVREIRRQKGMFLVQGDPDVASAGSFFKNPVVDQALLQALTAKVPPGTAVPHYPAGDGKVKLAAAWLLEAAGYRKGYGDGPAGISSRHTLALVNRGGATASQILGLSEEISAEVERKFGVRLEREPVYLGEQ